MPLGRSKSLFHLSEQDKSRRNRTRVYSFRSVVHESIAEREAKGGLATEVSSHALCPLGIASISASSCFQVLRVEWRSRLSCYSTPRRDSPAVRGGGRPRA